MPARSPGEKPLLDRAKSLIDAAPASAYRSGGSPWLRYAWEARDLLVELVIQNEDLLVRLAWEQEQRKYWEMVYKVAQ